MGPNGPDTATARKTQGMDPPPSRRPRAGRCGCRGGAQYAKCERRGPRDDRRGLRRRSGRRRHGPDRYRPRRSAWCIQVAWGRFRASLTANSVMYRLCISSCAQRCRCPRRPQRAGRVDRLGGTGCRALGSVSPSREVVLPPPQRVLSREPGDLLLAEPHLPDEVPYEFGIEGLATR